MVTDSNPKARVVNPSVPAYVSDALALGLQLDPVRRIQTVPQLSRALSSPTAAEEEARTAYAAGRRKAREKKGKPSLSLTAILTSILILLAVLTLLTLWSLLARSSPSSPRRLFRGLQRPQRGDGELCPQLCGDELLPDPEQPGIHRHLSVLCH